METEEERKERIKKMVSKVSMRNVDRRIRKIIRRKEEVVFDTSLVKMKVSIKMAEDAWKKALKLLEGDCPKKGCVWCDGR